MKLHELKNTPGARRKRTRVGRGDGSGQGHTCGRGHKGQKSRSGCHHRPYFEGGQITFFRRLPKRGFNSPDHKTYSVLNVGIISESFSADEQVDSETVIQKGLVAKLLYGLKILGDGEIDKPVVVKAKAFSKSAKEKIEKAGGRCEVVA